MRSFLFRFFFFLWLFWGMGWFFMVGPVCRRAIEFCRYYFLLLFLVLFSYRSSLLCMWFFCFVFLVFCLVVLVVFFGNAFFFVSFFFFLGIDLTDGLVCDVQTRLSSSKVNVFTPSD